MKIAIITVTKKGLEKSYEIKNKINCDIYTLKKLQKKGDKLIKASLSETYGEIFKKYDAFIFITSTGIAIRVISSYIEGKEKDPAILVVDQEGNFVISLLSGHLGGANNLTNEISGILKSIPVITTASDISGKIAVDTIAMNINSKIENLEAAKKVTSLIVAGETVQLKIPENISSNNPSGVIIVSNREKIEISKIIPKNLVVGIGCKKGKEKNKIINAIRDSFIKNNLSLDGIKCFATIDIKKYEKGIVETAKDFKKELKIIKKEDIEKIHDKFEGSKFVFETVGVYSVSGPAAYLASNRKGKLLVEKLKYDGITISIFEEETRDG
ncbi:cobalt-precorrin 5A hydrolase [Fusobacterium sp. MFO224]|uniref:cobalt-precorrin 5A hydrolase n=1 Tax=Fusobacterium sp. MFO224 TaxID=3378070 RepID=UPI0038522458